MKLSTHYQQEKHSCDADIVNWRENYIGESLFYSYRATSYNSNTFPSRLHYHDYYELVVFEEGDISYICESDTYVPSRGDVLIIPPGAFHMSKINCDKTLYKRHVFYMYADALDDLENGILTQFLKQQGKGISVVITDKDSTQELFALLSKLDRALEHNDDRAYRALSAGLIIQILFIIGKGQPGQGKKYAPLPENLVSIKKYIDENYLEVSSAGDIAARFFYSREYISRLFRKHFNTTISEYIKARRIAYSQQLLEQGYNIGGACYGSGFDNMSTFIRVFRNVTDMTPSEYRKTRIKQI